MRGPFTWLARCWHRLRQLAQLPYRLHAQSLSLARLEQAIHNLDASIDARLQTLRTPTPTASLTRLAELEESLYLLEQRMQAADRTAADRALRDRYPPRADKQDGLSVLIPCWNHARFLPQAMASAQAALDLLSEAGEILILDDASRDDSLAVAQQLASEHPRIKAFAAPANVGLARARNFLLDQARYRHAIMLDADNAVVPAGVALLYRAAHETGAALVHGQVIVEEQGRVRGVFSHDRAGPDLFSGNYIDALALIDVAQVQALGGYTREVPGYEDWELLLHLLRRRCAVVYVPTVAGRYRSSPLSMIHDAAFSRRKRLVQRIHAIDGVPADDDLDVGVYHPELGYLWHSPGSVFAHAACGTDDMDEESRQSVPLTISMSKAQDRHILVVSSGGVRNYGDDAILLATLERLQRVLPGCIPTVVSDGADVPPLGSLGVWAGTCQELVSSFTAAQIQRGWAQWPAAVRRINSRGHLHGTRALFPPDELRSYDAVLFSGGGNLASYWPQLILWRAAIAAAATEAGTPYLVSGQGLGPLDEAGWQLLQPLLAGAARFAVRDPLSYRLLQDRHLAGPNVDSALDDALGLADEDPFVLAHLLSEAGVPTDKPLLGFQVRMAEYVDLSREKLLAWVRLVDATAAQLGWDVVGLPINDQSWNAEVDLLQDLIAQAGPLRTSWHVCFTGANVRALRGLVRSCSAMITCSFHLAVFALEAGIPALLLANSEYYERKARGLAELVRLPIQWSHDPSATAEALTQRLRVLLRWDGTTRLQSERVDRWFGQALRQVLSPSGLRQAA